MNLILLFLILNHVIVLLYLYTLHWLVALGIALKKPKGTETSCFSFRSSANSCKLCMQASLLQEAGTEDTKLTDDTNNLPCLSTNVLIQVTLPPIS